MVFIPIFLSYRSWVMYNQSVWFDVCMADLPSKSLCTFHFISNGRIRKVTKQDVDPIEVVQTVDNNNDSRKSNKNNPNCNIQRLPNRLQQVEVHTINL